MEAPPPFSQPGPPLKKKSNTTLIVVIILVCLLIPCIGIIAVAVFGFKFFNETVGPAATCAISFQQIRKGVIDYTEDHNGAFPAAETWQDDVRPYYKKLVSAKKDEYGPFQPADPDGDWGCKVNGKPMTGIAFNTNLSGKKMADIKNPYETILIFEIEKAMKNAHEPYKARSNSSSPMIMGDTHRGWLKMPIKGGSEDDFNFGDSNVHVRTESSSSDEEEPKGEKKHSSEESPD